MGARYYDPEVGRFTQPEPAWSNPMFNSIGGRNLLTERVFNTSATIGQETMPMPGGYYLPSADYNWYSYAWNDPINNLDPTGYGFWRKLAGALLITLAELPVAAMVVAGAMTGMWPVVFVGIEVYEAAVWPALFFGIYLIMYDDGPLG